MSKPVGMGLGEFLLRFAAVWLLSLTSLFFLLIVVWDHPIIALAVSIPCAMGAYKAYSPPLW